MAMDEYKLPGHTTKSRRRAGLRSAEGGEGRPKADDGGAAWQLLASQVVDARLAEAVEAATYPPAISADGPFNISPPSVDVGAA
jgi:hypothetical protein